MHRFGLATFVLIFAFTTFVLVAPQASATPLACPNNIGNSILTGAFTDASNQIFGSRANIEYNNPQICTGNPSNGISVVWAMVTAASDTYPANPNDDMWAQTGYGRFGGDSGFDTDPGVFVFTQTTKACKADDSCSGLDATTYFFYYSLDTSDPWYYGNRYNNSTGRMDLYADGDYLTQTAYDPIGVWDSAWEGQFFGETKQWASDLPGYASDPTGITAVTVQDSNGDLNPVSALHGVTPTDDPDGTLPYHRQLYTLGGNPAVRIWTDR